MKVDLKEQAYLEWLYPTNLFLNRDEVIKNAAYKRRLDYDCGCFMWDEAMKLQAELINALEKIANQDYRGNRSTESTIAYNTLQSFKKGTEVK